VRRFRYGRVRGRHRAALSAHDARIRGGINRAGGLTVVHEGVGTALPDNREHFGYADGFAQPDIEGAGVPSLPGDGAPLRGDKWRPIRAGEFVLGYPDEEDVEPQAPTPAELAVNGSFLVYRKLHQDVAAFRAQLAKAARLFPGGEQLLAAKILGRWRDGTPIDLSPDRPDPVIVADGERNNNFSYTSDADGMRCPVGAHVRRANPRDSVPFEGKLVNRHRIIRRGIPYGEPLPAGAEDDGRDRGVIFMCLQACIARQFEFIQSQWMNRGNAFTLGEDQDVLVGTQTGAGPHKMTVPGNPPFFVGPLQRVVTVRGGEYFFRPGHQRSRVPGLGRCERSGMSGLQTSRTFGDRSASHIGRERAAVLGVIEGAQLREQVADALRRGSSLSSSRARWYASAKVAPPPRSVRARASSCFTCVRSPAAVAAAEGGGARRT
jgi:Dyp-type peroxidase family